MRRGLRYALGTTVAAAVLASTVVGWTFIDKSVTVSVDGAISKRIQTISLDVRGALRDAGYPVGPHDDVTPAPNAALREGTTIRLERGRELRLDVDGTVGAVWVAAPTVGTALADLGYSPQVYSSLPGSAELPLTITELTVRTVKTVTLVRAGVTNTVDTTAASVGDLLADEGISPGPHDRLSVPASTHLSNGMMIVWQKVRHLSVVDNQSVDFTTTYRSDPAKPRGTTTIRVVGRPGTVAITYDVMTVDGKQVGKTELGRSTVVDPVAEVVLVGSAVPAPPAQTTSRFTRTPSPPRPGINSPASRTSAPAAPAPPPRPAPKPAQPAPPKPAPPRVTAPPAVAPEAEPAPKPVPKPAPKPVPKAAPSPITTVITVTPGSAQALARQLLPQWGWSNNAQWTCLQVMWTNESSWRVDALNPSSGAYGIPQALPGNRMAAAGADWRTNPRTQIRWGLDYIDDRYGNPCIAWSFWQAHGWY